MDKKVKQIEFDASNNDSKEYEVEVIWNNAIYARESKSDYLSSLYYLVSWKEHLEKKNPLKPASVV